MGKAAERAAAADPASKRLPMQDGPSKYIPALVMRRTAGTCRRPAVLLL